jgi:hypothetical protein
VNRKSFHPSLWGLVAFWAFVESGLGGLMHAFHLPFTGIFIGGAAVASLAAMAAVLKGQDHPAGLGRQLMVATLWVMLVKLLVSPQSPPTSYIAVAFQGVMAAIFYSVLPSYKLASFLFAVVAMLESALQKLLILFLVFGTEFWESLDIWMISVSKQLAQVPLGLNALAGSYVLLYACWGLYLAYRISIWPQRFAAQNEELKKAFSVWAGSVPEVRAAKRFKPFRWVLLAVAVLVFYLLPSYEAWSTLIRALAFSVALYGLAPMVMRFWRQRLEKKQQSPEVQAMLTRVDSQGNLFRFCWEYHSEKGKVGRMLAAVESALVLAASDDER